MRLRIYWWGLKEKEDRNIYAITSCQAAINTTEQKKIETKERELNVILGLNSQGRPL